MSRNRDPCTCRTRKAIPHSPLDAVRAMTHAKVQESFRCEPKGREPAVPYIMRRIAVLWNPVLSMFTKIGKSVFGMKSII